MRNYFVKHNINKVGWVKLVKKRPQVSYFTSLYFVDKYFSDSKSIFSVLFSYLKHKSS